MYTMLVSYYHKLSGLNNVNILFHSSGSQESDMPLSGLKPMCLQDCIPPGCSKGEFISLLFLASKGHLHSLVCDPLLQQASIFLAFSSVSLFLL